MNTLNIPADLVLTYGDQFSVKASDITETGLLYLLQNGYSQSVQDARAGVATKMKEKDANVTEAAIKTAEHEKMQAKSDAIVAGTISIRAGGARLTGIDKIMRDVAREAIRKAIVAAVAKDGKKRTIPTGDKMTDLVEQYIAKNETAVRAEANRRLDTKPEIDADLLAMIDE